MGSNGCRRGCNITLDTNGYGLACGGISASLRDLARFGIVMLQEGSINGKQVIPISWVKDVRHGQHGLPLSKYFKNGSYRNQYWIEDNHIGSHYSLGVFGQLIYVAPQFNMVAVKFSTWPTFSSEELVNDTANAIAAIARELG